MSLERMLFNRAVAADDCSRAKTVKMRLVNYFGGILLASTSLFSDAADLMFYRSITMGDGYSNCRYIDNTGIRHQFNLTVDFRPMEAGNVPGFLNVTQRSLMIYTYDAKGLLKAIPNTYEYVGVIMGNVSANNWRDLTGWGVWTNAASTGPWVNRNAHSADVRVFIDKNALGSWSAIGVRAAGVGDANVSRDAVSEIKGMAYIRTDSNGSCMLVGSPETPPPAITPKVTMTAPDWDLGELPAGEETVLTLPATKDQLCFNYQGSTAIANQKYLINATNSNGFSPNGRYLLKSLEDSSQTVPYTLTLDNSIDSVSLPNAQSRLFSLDAGGRTCFTPTFKAQPDKTVKTGAYSDILTFTVVAKP